jgi:hypothetical protein
MASTGATGLDVITLGAAVAVTSPPAGKGPVAAPWPVSPPAGFGNGWNSGDDGGEARRGKTLGAAAADSEENGGVIFGGSRRIGMTGGREGRTIRTVSVFGSAMGGWGYD